MRDKEFNLIRNINSGNFGAEIMEEIDELEDPVKEACYYNKAILSHISSGNYDSSLILSLGGMLGLTIARIKDDQRKLEKLIMTDDLTGLLNRRGFDSNMINEVARANRSDFKGNTYDFSLMIVDIDYFKKFNDSYGHQAGDKVLRTLGGILNDGRKSDIPCRYGGEEFGIILPDTDVDGALESAYKLNRKVADRVIRFEDEDGKKYNEPINVSIGVDGFRQGDSVESIVKRADDNLYAAKDAGRNCVYGDGSVYR